MMSSECSDWKQRVPLGELSNYFKLEAFWLPVWDRGDWQIVYFIIPICNLHL